MIIGLTGGIACGKSTVANFFRELGALVIDSDSITRELVAPGQPTLSDIVQHFGPGILKKDGSLDRTQLRNLIFADPKEREWLEALLHPLVKEHILKKNQTIPTGQYQIIEIPLLFEANFQDAVDRVLVVDCLDAIQKERAGRRDAMPLPTLEAIMKSQISRSERLQRANDVIENNDNLNTLKKKVESLHYYYTELSKL